MLKTLTSLSLVVFGLLAFAPSSFGQEPPVGELPAPENTSPLPAPQNVPAPTPMPPVDGRPLPQNPGAATPPAGGPALTAPRVSAPRPLSRIPAGQETPAPAPGTPAPTASPEVVEAAPVSIPQHILYPNLPRPYDSGQFTWKWIPPEVDVVSEKVVIPGTRELVLAGHQVSRVVDHCGYVREISSPTYNWVSTPSREEVRNNYRVNKPGYWVPVQRCTSCAQACEGRCTQN